ncbi:DUF4865 family protein [Photobacterium sp. TY1-4]|nr:DUF4865 family protein [Photobacterium sp. TY1-4]
MIAMQYKFVLPADYPMASIEHRIKDKGHLLNGFPGLIFKTYLYARKDATHYASPVNCYAPFYVWENHHAMVAFLQSEGFKALCEQFGQPKVETWFVNGELTAPTAEHELAVIRIGQQASGQHTHVQGINYSTWQPLEVIWVRPSEAQELLDGDVYVVGYIARGNCDMAPTKL